jgi:hypothetical protein
MFTSIIPLPSTASKGLTRANMRLQSLLHAISEKEVSEEVKVSINQFIEAANAAASNDAKAHKKALNKGYNQITKLIQKEHGYVVKGSQMALWMVIGMVSFGTAIGVVFGIVMENMGLMGIGYGFGMAIGLAIGAVMEEKARKEEKQLVVKGSGF